MNFLKRFYSICEDFLHRLYSGDANELLEIKPTDSLARFLLQSSHFSHTKFRVKPGALLPNRDGETSVFMVSELDEHDIWQIGYKHLSEPLGRTLYARAEVFASLVEGVGLQIEFDNTPPRHANIVGWPEEKSEQKLRALELASDARLILNPEEYP